MPTIRYQMHNNVPLGTPGFNSNDFTAFIRGGVIKNVTVGLRIQHTYMSDVKVSLKRGSETAKTIVSSIGSSGDNFGTGTGETTTFLTFDDNAPSAPPTGIQSNLTGSYKSNSLSLTQFRGTSAESNWVLNISDTVPADVGVILNAYVEVYFVDVICLGTSYELRPIPNSIHSWKLEAASLSCTSQQYTDISTGTPSEVTTTQTFLNIVLTTAPSTFSLALTSTTPDLSFRLSTRTTATSLWQEVDSWSVVQPDIIEVNPIIFFSQQAIQTVTYPVLTQSVSVVKNITVDAPFQLLSFNNSTFRVAVPDSLADFKASELCGKYMQFTFTRYCSSSLVVQLSCEQTVRVPLIFVPTLMSPMDNITMLRGAPVTIPISFDVRPQYSVASTGDLIGFPTSVPDNATSITFTPTEPGIRTVTLTSQCGTTFTFTITALKCKARKNTKPGKDGGLSEESEDESLEGARKSFPARVQRSSKPAKRHTGTGWNSWCSFY